jgi:hypothetical protein
MFDSRTRLKSTPQESSNGDPLTFLNICIFDQGNAGLRSIKLFLASFFSQDTTLTWAKRVADDKILSLRRGRRVDVGCTIGVRR